MGTIRSMTAFARTERQHEHALLSWEIKSVNHRYLDISIRLPDSLKHLENAIRQQLRNTLSRGKVELSLRIDESSTEERQLEVDEHLVTELNKAREKIEALLIASKPVSASDIMKWPGVVRAKSLDLQSLETPALESLDEALNCFVSGREREGESLAQMITQRLEKIDGFIQLFRQNMPETLRRHHEKLQQRLMQLLEKQSSEVDQQRLEQELVIFAQKIDIEEELDRLEAHCQEVRRILEEGGAVGRQLDFLMQELNREANTTGSKSASAEQSQAVVDLKVLIEQMREQIQNIE